MPWDITTGYLPLAAGRKMLSRSDRPSLIRTATSFSKIISNPEAVFVVSVDAFVPASFDVMCAGLSNELLLLCRLLRLEAQLVHQCVLIVVVFLDVSCERIGRRADHKQLVVLDDVLHVRRRQRLRRLLVDAVDAILRHAGGKQDSEVAGQIVIAETGFGHGG